MSAKIIKADGSIEEFDLSKLIKSMIRAGADENIIDEVVSKLSKKDLEGMTTKSIYQIAYRILKKRKQGAAARYKLKQAILNLGPTGFPFETFIAQLLKYQGYKVKTGIIKQGKCVDHEIDVIAEKDGKIIYSECKFHNDHGLKCNVKIPLYINSRFDDILNYGSFNEDAFTGILYTNTKFTDDAIQYGTCIGLELIGWDYPDNKALRDIIDKAELHPITCLSNLSNKEKKLLLKNDVVLCRQILENKPVLKKLGIKHDKIKLIIEEVQNVCPNI